MARFRFASALAVVVVLCAVLGGLFGRSSVVAQDQLADKYKGPYVWELPQWK